MNEPDEIDARERMDSSYAGPGRFVPGRIHLSEWLVGIGGLAMLAGLFMPWSGGAGAVDSFSLLKALLALAGLAAFVLPMIVALSSRTDFAIAWETLLAVGVTLLMLPLLVRLLLPPEGGLELGFFVVLAATVLMMLACWRSVAREY